MCLCGSLRAQLLVFAGASVVVAVHGAGLANLIMVRPGALVIEIMPMRPDVNACYMDLAVKLRLRSACQPCKPSRYPSRRLDAFCAAILRRLHASFAAAACLLPLSPCLSASPSLPPLSVSLSPLSLRVGVLRMLRHIPLCLGACVRACVREKGACVRWMRNERRGGGAGTPR